MTRRRFGGIAEACHALGVIPPDKPLPPCRWSRLDVDAGPSGRKDASILPFADGGALLFNHRTGEQAWIAPLPTCARNGTGALVGNEVGKEQGMAGARVEMVAREARIAARRARRIMAVARPMAHPYLARKGFGAIHWPVVRLVGAAWAPRPPQLVVPASVDGDLTSVQLIGPDGTKRNLPGGAMHRACCTIHTGPPGARVLVAEGLATALTIAMATRAAGIPATILAAFCARNASIVAHERNAILMADHDPPLARFGGRGTAEFWARTIGVRFVLPPEPGDWNDFMTSHGRDATIHEIARALHNPP